MCLDTQSNEFDGNPLCEVEFWEVFFLEGTKTFFKVAVFKHSTRRCQIADLVKRLTICFSG